MNRYTDSISFKQRAATGTAEDYQKGFIITAWIMYVGGSIYNPVTGEFYCDVVNSSDYKRPGRTYHLFLKSGDLIHTGGFDKANHFIKLPLSWKDEIYDTVTTDAYTDEENVEHPAITTNITNGEYYGETMHNIKKENTTHCLVKFTDSNYQQLNELITETADNIYAEAYYFKQISETYTAADGTTKQGEFYIEPKNIE